MKLTFFGAAKAVTGSCHCVEVRGKKILIDCGLQQGRDERDNAVFDFSPNYIDYVIVTHAHIDHVGMLPYIYARGFKGRVIATNATCDLCNIMLKDSAHIQEMDAEWKNRKARRAGRPKAGGPAPGGAPLYCGRCGPSGRAFGHRGVWTDHRTL